MSRNDRPAPTLASQIVKPRKGAADALSRAAVDRGLVRLPDWRRSKGGNAIERTYRFADYYRTMTFVNAVAWMAHAADHHPDLEVGYDRCLVRYSTHDVGGLSQNDLICAARCDLIFANSAS